MSEKQIAVNDSRSSKAPRVITMEPWHQLIFLAADGQHEIQEFIDHMANEYDPIPDGLAEQILSLIGVLEGEGILEVSDEKVQLPPFWHEEYFAESPETRKQQMIEAGILEN
ncbi:hypothetical protein [Cerasicoccus frondis]|uniref:hypothetical protein n=1 Tax=Cerasicoccus frondis TaxID=490090 RepID=UPI002852ACC8|nr:hypothetical protein [Cerasicoccus frondis]